MLDPVYVGSWTPVPNSKCVSVLGHYKCNSSSIRNHRLTDVTFFYLSDLHSVWFYNGQTWTKYKNKVSYGDGTRNLPHPRRLSSFLRHHDCWKVFFCAVNICLKEAAFTPEMEQNILHGRFAFTIAQYWSSVRAWENFSQIPK